MKRVLITISIVILAFSACKKSSDSSQSGFEIFSTDDTKEVTEIIVDANEDLKKVKKIYKANQNRVSDLKLAMTNKEIDKFKTNISELAIEIKEGLEFGASAVSKIEKAEGMNINDTYKEYLRLKKQALNNQLEAFQLRLQAAQEISKSLTTNDPDGFKKAAVILKEKEESFQKLMDQAKDMSQEANQIAKDATKKQ